MEEILQAVSRLDLVKDLANVSDKRNEGQLHEGFKGDRILDRKREASRNSKLVITRTLEIKPE